MDRTKLQRSVVALVMGYYNTNQWSTNWIIKTWKPPFKTFNSEDVLTLVVFDDNSGVAYVYTTDPELRVYIAENLHEMSFEKNAPQFKKEEVDSLDSDARWHILDNYIEEYPWDIKLRTVEEAQADGVDLDSILLPDPRVQGQRPR